MDDLVWLVGFSDPDGTVRATQVKADGWQLSPNGDLVFIDDPYGERPFGVQAFAAGTWRGVSLYS